MKWKQWFMASLLAILLLSGSALWAQSSEKRIIMLVRHAEKELPPIGAEAKTMAGSIAVSNPKLSTVGKVRAQELVSLVDKVLKREGAVPIASIYATEFDRTQQTEQPLASALKITPIIIPANDIPALVKSLRASSGSVVVVGHSNTLPDIITQLTSEVVEPILEKEYNKVFVITIEGKKKVLSVETYGTK